MTSLSSSKEGFCIAAGMEEWEEEGERMGVSVEGDGGDEDLDFGFRRKRVVRKLRFDGRGVDRTECWVDKFVSQVCKSRFSSSTLVSLNPQYDRLIKKNGF